MTAISTTSSTVATSLEHTEIARGYKHMDIGVLPNDWYVVEIGGLSPFVTSGSRGWARFYSDIGAPFIRITNLSRKAIDLDLEDLRFVELPAEAMVEASRTRLEDGDILISITADIGIIGYVDSCIPKPAYMNQHIALIRFDPSRVCGRYVAYSLASERPQRLFLASMDIGAKAGMSLITVRKIRFPLPALPEQRAIAAALSDVDELIGALDKLIAKKRAIKLATMQQLLTGKTRLPGFSGEWETFRQSEVAEFINGRAYSRHEWETSGVPVCRLQNLTGSGEEFYYSTLKLPEKQYMEDGDLIFMWSASFGPYIWRGPRAIYHYHIWKVVCDGQKANRNFYYHKLVELTQALKSTTDGSTMLHLTKKGMEQYEVVLPPVEEQFAIAAVLSDMETEITALEQRRDKTKAIKQGMMQSLLTGRVRLVEPEGTP